MTSLDRPVFALVAVIILGGTVLLTRNAHAGKELEQERVRVQDLKGRLDGLSKEAESLAAKASREGSSDVAALERGILARSLAPERLPALLERIRAAAKKAALRSLDADSVRETRVQATPRLTRVEVQLSVTTDWPHLGGLLGDLTGLAPVVALEETTVLRAEEVPVLGVRVLLATYVAAGGAAAEPAPVEAAAFEGPGPFFLPDELESKKSRRHVAPPWTGPRIELEGVVYRPRASQVIVNGAAVAEGTTFQAGTESVKVLEVTSPSEVRFQVGERILLRTLPPLGGPR